jgi:aryl-alcohol dehydrogenase-like predicted oxidoreductase
VAHGGTFFDTAKVYADWLPGERSVSEKTLGRWLRQRGHRDRLVIATKGAHPELATMHQPRMDHASIVADLEQSLRNLQTDVIDLYWLHRDDPQTPVAAILVTLQAQVRAGKIRAYGCSNWRAGRIAEAQVYARTQGWPGFVADQMSWSLAAVPQSALPDPTMVVMDGALFDLHAGSGMPAAPYASQANGFFQRAAAGTLDAMQESGRRLYDTPENRRRSQAVQALAAESGRSISAIVLGYLLGQPFPVLPIVGCRSVAQVEDSCRAVEQPLSAAEIAFVEGRSGR